MRVKLLFLAGSLAAFVAALVFGAEMCMDAGQQQQQATIEAGSEASEAAAVPSPTKGGVKNANENLREFKSGMQEQMNRRGDSLDGRIERSGTKE